MCVNGLMVPLLNDPPINTLEEKSSDHFEIPLLESKKTIHDLKKKGVHTHAHLVFLLCRHYHFK